MQPRLTFIENLPQDASTRQRELQRAEARKHAATVSHLRRRGMIPFSRTPMGQKRRCDRILLDDTERSVIKSAKEASPSEDISTDNFFLSNTTKKCTAITTWRQLAPSVSRSQQALIYWSAVIPNIAWVHPTVQNAMIAVSLSLQSLRRTYDVHRSALTEARALEYGHKCIRDLLAATLPPEAVIASCTLFWVFEFLCGNPLNAMRHLAGGTRVAMSVRLSDLSDPFGAQFVRSLVGDLPISLHPDTVTNMSKDGQHAQKLAQQRYSLRIMRDALRRLDDLQGKIATSQSFHKAAATQIISRTERVLNGIARGWPEDLLSINEDSAPIIQRAILDHSPFILIIEDAKRFFEDDDLKWIQEFERKFRPAVDFFVWSSASRELSFRHHVIEIWDRQRPAQPLTNRTLPTSELGDGC